MDVCKLCCHRRLWKSWWWRWRSWLSQQRPWWWSRPPWCNRPHGRRLWVAVLTFGAGGPLLSEMSFLDTTLSLYGKSLGEGLYKEDTGTGSVALTLRLLWKSRRAEIKMKIISQELAFIAMLCNTAIRRLCGYRMRWFMAALGLNKFCLCIWIACETNIIFPLKPAGYVFN